MHILRLSILSLTLALAVMTLGYVTPLQAQVCDPGAFCDRDFDSFFKDHKRCDMCGGPTDCDDSDGGLTDNCADTGLPKTTYSVEMVIGVEKDGGDVETCTMGTTSQDLGASFPINSCPIELDDDVFPTGDYCVKVVEVRNNRKGTDVMIFFSNACNSEHFHEGWHTLLLPAEIMMGGLGDFMISLNDPTGLILTKIKQPEKNKPLDDTIFVGDIIYTKNP